MYNKGLVNSSDCETLNGVVDLSSQHRRVTNMRSSYQQTVPFKTFIDVNGYLQVYGTGESPFSTHELRLSDIELKEMSHFINDATEQSKHLIDDEVSETETKNYLDVFDEWDKYDFDNNLEMLYGTSGTSTPEFDSSLASVCEHELPSCAFSCVYCHNDGDDLKQRKEANSTYELVNAVKRIPVNLLCRRGCNIDHSECWFMDHSDEELLPELESDIKRELAEAYALGSEVYTEITVLYLNANSRMEYTSNFKSDESTDTSDSDS